MRRVRLLAGLLWPRQLGQDAAAAEELALAGGALAEVRTCRREIVAVDRLLQATLPAGVRLGAGRRHRIGRRRVGARAAGVVITDHGVEPLCGFGVVGAVRLGVPVGRLRSTTIE